MVEYQYICCFSLGLWSFSFSITMLCDMSLFFFGYLCNQHVQRNTKNRVMSDYPLSFPTVFFNANSKMLLPLERKKHVQTATVSLSSDDLQAVFPRCSVWIISRARALV